MDKRNASNGTIIRKLEIRKESEKLNKRQKYSALTLCTSAQKLLRDYHRRHDIASSLLLPQTMRHAHAKQ